MSDYRWTLIALVCFAINVPMAWGLLLHGFPYAAIAVITMGNVIIWWIVWKTGAFR